MSAPKFRKMVVLMAAAAMLATACSSGSGSSTSPAASAPGAAASEPAATSSGGASSTTPIKIGVLATLSGPFASLGQDGLRGAQMALNEYKDAATGKWMVAGREVQMLTEGTDATPGVALEKAKKLIEQDGVDILVGPLSGDEGLAIKEYAKTVPDKTFINGPAGATGISLRDPLPNFFNFTPNGPQQIAGLGKFAYEVKGYHTIATVGEDYSYPYSNIGGFMYEFCPAGGHVVQKNWVPIGTKDFSSVITALPKNVDAIMVALGGADAVNFFKQYSDAGGTAKFIGGSISVDQNVLSTKALPQDRLVGLISAASTADNDPEASWTSFVATYKATFPDGLPYPGLFTLTYYNPMKAALLALAAVNGDLSNGEAKLMEAVGKISVDGPTGTVSLDDMHAGIVSSFVVEVVKDANGNLTTAVQKKVDNVTQTDGLAMSDPLMSQDVSREWPSCP